MGLKKTNEQFIEDAIKIHGSKFDYSLTQYKGVKSKIKIKCPNNHIFNQTPNDHLNGHGCKKCSGWGELISSNGEFIKRLKKIYKNNLKYDLAEYVGWDIKTNLECREHGIFEKTPSGLLNKKQGCPKCGRRRTGEKNNMGIEEFIKRGKLLNGDNYDYSLVKYVNATTPITIVCPSHGKFTQRPKDHLNKSQGCPTCNKSKGEKKIQRILEQLNIQYHPQYKFDKCFNKRKLPFDFYLPKHNMCIEFDGEQHFFPVEKFGGVKAFEYIKVNDEIKDKYCKENNILLIRISYKQINKIKQIIKIYV